ncbi:glycosyltransferase [Verrucomicrobiaceae bacterium R5-34]|uniref:Glycosyltransferase n=1 Tax=Oceaniferula flava TaxID=2800421 RepID=A0AAE2SCT1_9BACT|nr:glycosyltransferase [Oceaniferula flavus]MBK1832191.1 glycosyltransferase [Verrucomicrobiaceae bacterium R5-34]MBK1855841.1 glycosyltransferase [Oceaniferula flavus]MBM1137148.1 glycosyltransferase [Oceaniferula flavus]
MRLLLVFLKEPLPGKVKTRLAQDVGHEEAARYYRALVEVLLKQLQGLEKCRIRFCYAPDDANDAIRFWLLPLMNGSSGEEEGVYLSPTALGEKYRQEIDFRPQGEGDLGERMARAFDDGFADGYQHISIIGTDCPDCGARWINAGFSRMASPQRDGIIGPSTDGGYYLLGLKSPCPELFQNIPWSQADVLAKTLVAAGDTNLTLEQLPPLTDIDHIDDWNRAMAGPLGASLKKALGEELDETI